MRWQAAQRTIIASTVLCSLLTPGPSLAQGEGEAQALCQAAEITRQQAATRKYEWTTIKPLLDQAATAMSDANYPQAAALCREAQMQAQLALQQAAREASHWHKSIPR